MLGDANIDVAANRIMWGKCLNAGQTCIAPDYILCQREKQDELVKACKRAMTEFYGPVGVPEQLDLTNTCAFYTIRTPKGTQTLER